MSDFWWDVTSSTSFGEKFAWIVTYRVGLNCILGTPRKDAPFLPGGNRKDSPVPSTEAIGAKAWGQGRESLSRSSREDNPSYSTAVLIGMNPGLTSLAVELISGSSVLLSFFGGHHKILIQCPSRNFPA